MNKEKIKNEIENIEQLSANARYYYNCDNLEHLLIEIDSIMWWCKSIKRRLKKIENNEIIDKINGEE